MLFRSYYQEERLKLTLIHAPKATQQTNDPTVGRDIKAECMLTPSMPRKVVRDQIHWMSMRTPCAAWRAIWNREHNSEERKAPCALCPETWENVEHIQTSCKALHGAITKAHDTCWYNIWEALIPELQKLGYEAFFETPLDRVPNFPYTLIEELRPRKPDATLIYRAIERKIGRAHV